MNKQHSGGSRRGSGGSNEPPLEPKSFKFHGEFQENFVNLHKSNPPPPQLIWTPVPKILAPSLQQQSDCSIHDTFTHCPPVCTKFQLCRPHFSWENWYETFYCLKIGEKEKEDIKGWISSSSLIVVYMIHPPIIQLDTKFQLWRHHSFLRKKWRKFSSESVTEWQLCKHHSSWEKCGETFHLKALQNDRVT